LSSSDSQDILTGPEAWLHFAGVGGSGMSALAQFHAQAGGTATGSDRAFDANERGEIRRALEGVGVEITPQDGSFPATFKKKCDAMVVSTAVEDDVPDVRASRDKGVPILHRSELLARYVENHRTIAVTGTSGKSTVTAMVFSILRGCGRGPGLLTGGALTGLQAEGHLGNAWGPSPRDGEEPLLAIEADESDGSLVRYRPWCGVVLNLGLDHKSPAEVMAMFETFSGRTTGPLVVGAEDNLAQYAPRGMRFGIGPDPRSGTWAANVDLQDDGSTFTVEGVEFTLPEPGKHNVLNALSAIAACREVGVTLPEMVAPLTAFQGVARRFNRIGTAGDVTVIDDFAHNPDKITAALETAHGRSGPGRVLAVFQPHGYGPTRFLRTALVDTFKTSLNKDDVLWLPEIFYAGGTVTRDISSGDLVEEILAGGRQARFVPDRSDIPTAIAAEARPGDLVLVMGARDPSLTDFCREILACLG